MIHLLFLSLTFDCGDCTFAAWGGENAFKFLYQSRTTPCNNNKKQEAMKINTLQNPPKNHPIAFRRLCGQLARVEGGARSVERSRMLK